MEKKYKLKDVLNWFGNRGTPLNKGSFLRWEMNNEWIHVIPNQKNELIQQTYMFCDTCYEVGSHEILAFKVKSLCDEIYDQVECLYKDIPKNELLVAWFNANYYQN